jgi:hypothetical protein
VYLSLSIEKALLALHGKNTFVPDARVDIYSSSSIAPECDDILRFEVVTGKRSGDHEGLSVQGEEQLTAVRMIVHVPQYYVIRLPCGPG